MLKIFFMTSFLLIVSFSISANTVNFMPDNDLWKYDRINKSTADTEKEMFEKIINIAKEIYNPIAESNGEALEINALWDDPTVNANCSRFWGTVTINMYGGLFRRAEISYEGFALVLCHEASHAFSGAPYISEWRKMSAEGQADYAGAKDCVEQILEKLNLDEFKFQPTDYMKKLCNETNVISYDLCLQSFTAGQSLGSLLSVLKKEPIPSYENPDTSVVDKTELSYPKTVACRLTTYLHGILHLDRPSCWYKN